MIIEVPSESGMEIYVFEGPNMKRNFILKSELIINIPVM